MLTTSAHLASQKPNFLILAAPRILRLKEPVFARTYRIIAANIHEIQMLRALLMKLQNMAPIKFVRAGDTINLGDPNQLNGLELYRFYFNPVSALPVVQHPTRLEKETFSEVVRRIAQQTNKVYP